MPKELLMLLGKNNNNKKLYKVFFVETVLGINTFLLLRVFPIFISGVFT